MATSASSAIGWSGTVSQATQQPPADSTDVASVNRGVSDAELGAIRHDGTLVAACDSVDYVTQQMAVMILADGQGQLRAFEGFLKECTKG